MYFRYEGDINDENSLNEAVDGSNGGPRNTSYTKLVAWVTGELKVLCQLEEEVNSIASSEDHSSFLMEVSAFLKEMGKFIIIIIIYYSCQIISQLIVFV